MVNVGASLVVCHGIFRPGRPSGRSGQFRPRPRDPQTVDSFSAFVQHRSRSHRDDHFSAPPLLASCRQLDPQRCEHLFFHLLPLPSGAAAQFPWRRDAPLRRQHEGPEHAERDDVSARRHSELLPDFSDTRSRSGRNRADDSWSRNGCQGGSTGYGSGRNRYGHRNDILSLLPLQTATYQGTQGIIHTHAQHTSAGHKNRSADRA